MSLTLHCKRSLSTHLMSVDPTSLIGEDVSWGSGEDTNVNGMQQNKDRQSRATVNSGPRKRSQKATSDAIVDAVLEIAAASKMRASSIMKNKERFSISKCTKVLGRMQGMNDCDIELDEMELVAAAAGYYYYNTMSKQPCHGASSARIGFMSEILNGDEDVSREMFRMNKHVFLKLCDILRKKNLLRDTSGVMIEEQVAIFLNIVGHNERNRVIQERFQHSGETISRYFNNVLKALKSLSREFLVSPPLSTPSGILSCNRFHPYFKDCIGVIDCMHLPAHVPAKDHYRFRNKKGVISQNVLAACTFDMQFIFVYPGWEGSVADSRVLRAVLDDPDQNFPPIPEGKYYLVDTDYSSMEGFIGPYHGIRYHLHEFRGANLLPQNAEELFNHRHSSLRNAIHKSFHVLKTRFPILKVAPQYAFHIQRDIVIAACILHNHIRREDRNDCLFVAAQGCNSSTIEEEEESPILYENGDDGYDDLLTRNQLPDLMMMPSANERQSASSLRDSVAAAMWNDFFHYWDEW